MAMFASLRHAAALRARCCAPATSRGTLECLGCRLVARGSGSVQRREISARLAAGRDSGGRNYGGLKKTLLISRLLQQYKRNIRNIRQKQDCAIPEASKGSRHEQSLPDHRQRLNAREDRRR